MNSLNAALAGQVLGAPVEWAHWQSLGLGADLLPVVSDLSVPISPASGIPALDGKTPTQIRSGMAVGLHAWTTRTTTAAEIARWRKDGRHGIGLVGRQVKAIDIDIADPAMADAVQGAIEAAVGPLPCRMRSNSGKRLLAFRMPQRMLKTTIKTAGGIIELLGDNQQFLVAGTHKTGVRYEWTDGLPADFPTLAPEDVEAIKQGLQAAFGLPGGSTTSRPALTPTKGRSAGDVADPAVLWLHENWDVTGEHASGVLDVRCPWESLHTSDTGASSTSYFPAGVGGEALAGFKCLHAHCDGRTIFDFNTATGYDNQADDFEVVTLDAQQQAEDAITRARNDNKPARVQLETQRERAVRIGRDGSRAAPTQRVMTGTEMLGDLVLIEEGSRVAHVSDPRSVLPFEEMKRALAGSVETAKNPAGRTTKVHRLQLWLEHPERKTVRCQTFAPGRAAFCMSPENVLAQNLWLPRTATVPGNWRELVVPFFKHVAYLVPNLGERERFLDWLAHIEQCPGTLPSTHYLLVARQTGIGRNWVAYALARVFAGHTALGFDLGEALRTGFNGALGQTLLVVVDELHEGGPGGSNRPAAEKLKSMLTETTRRVNPKYGRQHVEFNCARFLMFSNHEAALPLADNDRRVVVVENPAERRSASYYSELYALLENPDLGAALGAAFRQRDISGFNPGEVAPMTAAKARTIRAGRSEVEQAVRDVAADWGADCITSGLLTTAVGETLGGKSWNVQSACVAAGLVKYRQRVRVAGVPSHIWILRDVHKWADADPSAVSAEALRGQNDASAAEFG